MRAELGCMMVCAMLFLCGCGAQGENPDAGALKPTPAGTPKEQVSETTAPVPSATSAADEPNEPAQEVEVITFQGKEMLNDEGEQAIGLDLHEKRGAKIKKVILGSRVSVVSVDDYFETDPEIYQDYKNYMAGFPKLENISVKEGNNFYRSVDGMLIREEDQSFLVCPVKKRGEAVIPEGVKSLSRCALNGCTKLTSISLPASLERIGEAALGDNRSCTAYSVPESNQKFIVKDGVLYSRDMSQLISYPAGKEGDEFQVPEGVEEIWHAAFMGNRHLKKVVLPDTVKQLRNEAFKGCTSLETFIGGTGLRKLDAGVFYHCTRLKKVSFEKGLLQIAEGCFKGTKSLKQIQLPQSVVDIDYPGFSRDAVITVYAGSQAAYYCKQQWKTKEISAEKTASGKTGSGKKDSRITVDSNAPKGTGTPSTQWYQAGKTEFVLSSPDDLAGLAQLVNGGNSFKGCRISLSGDINLFLYKKWSCIGGRYKVNGKKKNCIFDGTFDGGGHTIYNLTVRKKSAYSGMFFRIGGNGRIQNITVRGADVRGGWFTGAIAGYSEGVIENCKVYGSVRGNNCTGGIVGGCCNYDTDAQTNVSGCENHAKVKGTEMVGGIVGEVRNLMFLCKNYGKVTGDREVGGIAGLSAASVDDCENYGTIAAYDEVAQIVGAVLTDEVEGLEKGKVVTPD